MKKICVAGLINIEITLQVESFPIHYFPCYYPFFGIHDSVSGVGYNVAKALHTLGDQVSFMSIIGADLGGGMVMEALRQDGLSGDFVMRSIRSTPHSVILYDKSGRRQIHVDLKDIQEQAYDPELFERASAGCSLAALCNINFSRPFLQRARHAGIPIATDVHAISRIDDEYNSDYMNAAHILFMSDELLPVSPEEWARMIMSRFGAEIVVVGMGAKGVLLSVRDDNFIERIPAAHTRKVINTIGAGDALFSSFIHYYQDSDDPYVSMEKAIVFASYKIGDRGAASGFLDNESLLQLWKEKKKE